MTKFPRLITALNLFIMCSICTTLSTINLDTGRSSSAARLYNLRCHKNFKCYWTTERTADFLIKLRGTVYNILTGVLASCLLVIGKTTGTPDYYLPWLFFNVKNMLFLQGPAIFRFAFNNKPLNTFFASAILLTSILLYAEEWCLWIRMFDCFKLLRKCRKNQLQKYWEGQKQAGFDHNKLQGGIIQMRI